jgi:hypothetical protein
MEKMSSKTILDFDEAIDEAKLRGEAKGVLAFAGKRKTA